VKVLYVCTANICRSPAAAALLREAAVPGVEVVSAGTHAAVGSPACSVVRELPSHASQPLTPALIEPADIVLTAAREHRTAVIEMYPGARSRTFTVRQAGRLAQWLLEAGMVEAALHGGDFADGDPRRSVAALPSPAQARASWVVEELDAARGMAPAPVSSEPNGRRWGRRGGDPQVHPDDVPDPHVLGTGWHAVAHEQLRESTEQVVGLLRAVL
jgi:protein-tyrosine-phosphatase